MTLVSTNYPTLSSLFDNMFDTEVSDWKRKNYSATQTTLPKVNIFEDKDGFTVEMAVPGMKKEDFEIKLDQNLLTISSEKNDEKKEVKYVRREFAYQSFKRSFTLPEAADDEKISAAYEQGVLRVSIPKKEEAKPVHRAIAVS